MDALARLRSAILHPDAQNQDDEPTITEQAMELASLPLRFITSPVVIRAYIRLLVFFFTSATLIAVSTTAYLIFYYNFIPQINLERTIYLQYSSDSHPHATVALQTEALIPQQAYDVSVVLHMPLSPINVAAGNFMLDVALISDPSASAALQFSPLLLNSTLLAGQRPVYRSRRPAIIPYQSQIIGLSQTILRLPSHILKIRDLDSTRLTIPMFELLSFPRGRINIPTHAYIQMQSQIPPSPELCTTGGFSLTQDFNVLSPSAGASMPSSIQTRSLQVYSAKLVFKARFEGLRHIVYNYRIISYLVFTNMFYFFAVGSMTVAWAGFSSWLQEGNSASKTNSNVRGRGTIKKEEQGEIKSEEPEGRRRLYDIEAERRGIEDDSSDPSNGEGDGVQTDSSTIFPGIGRTVQPLRYPGSPPSGRSTARGIDTPVTVDDAMHDAEDEDDNEEQVASTMPTQQSRSDDIDIKDEDDDDNPFTRDSGIGTSMESEPGGSSGIGLTRRRSGRGADRGR